MTTYDQYLEREADPDFRHRHNAAALDTAIADEREREIEFSGDEEVNHDSNGSA